MVYFSVIIYTLKEEYPDIIISVERKGHLGSATAFIIDKEFVSIQYNKYGFFVNVGDAHFAGQYFPTAEKAFDELAVWMHRYGYRFKKFDKPKERSGNLYGSVTRETIPA